MSQSTRSHVATGRRELSIGVPVRIENCRTRQRYRPGRPPMRATSVDAHRSQVISPRQRSRPANAIASASVDARRATSAKVNRDLDFGIRQKLAHLTETEEDFAVATYSRFWLHDFYPSPKMPNSKTHGEAWCQRRSGHSFAGPQLSSYSCRAEASMLANMLCAISAPSSAPGFFDASASSARNSSINAG